MTSPRTHKNPSYPEHEPSAGFPSPGAVGGNWSGTLSIQDSQVLIALLDRLGRCQDLPQLLQVGAQELCRLMAVDACSFLEIRGDSRVEAWLNLDLPHWPADAEWPSSEFPLDDFPFLQAPVAGSAPFQACLAGYDLAADVQTFLERLRAAAILLIPLSLDHGSAGWILLTDHEQPRTFGEEEIAFGQLLVRHVALTIERVRLRRDSEKREAELEAVLQAGLSLTASLELQEVLDAILKTTMSLIPGSEGAHIFLHENGRLRFAAALWAGGRMTTAFAEPRADGLTATVARTGELILVPDMRSHPLYTHAPAEWTGSIVGLPLKFRDRVVGVMNVANQRVDAFTSNDLRILGMLADHAAIAVENARWHELVKEQAETDVLTGLHNRRALDRQLDLELQRASRYQRPFSLVMLDLDNFKQVNDRYGHLEGDRVLKKIAACIQDVVRETDFLARYGGDEFAIVSADADAEAGQRLAKRIQEAIAKHPIALPGDRVMHLTVSVGLTTYHSDSKNRSDLLLIADQALYRAKNSGVGRIVMASELLPLQKGAPDTDPGGELELGRRF